MQVIENSYDRLVIGHRPWLMLGATTAMGLVSGWAALDGGDMDGLAERGLVSALALGLLWFGWKFFPLTRTVFSRPGGIVVHEERRVTGTRLKPLRLDDIDRAQVEAEWSDNTRLTRIVLVLAEGKLPLEGGYGPADRRAVETVINEWLTRPPA